MKKPVWKCSCGWEGKVSMIKVDDDGGKKCPKCGKSEGLNLFWVDAASPYLDQNEAPST